MQRGNIYRVGNCWMLRYRAKALNANGETITKQKACKLATYSNRYSTEASVRPLADAILAPTNAQTARPESTQTVADFLEHVYLPHCRETLRPSTCGGYDDMHRLVKPFLKDLQLREARTSNIDSLMKQVADSKQRAHTTHRNLKSFLSGAFRFAKRTDRINENPVRDSIVPRGKAKRDTPALTLAEIQKQLAVLPEPARTVILIAGLTGLRHSEIRGLRWEDFNGEELAVSRAVWGSHITDTKTLTSQAAVPVLPIVKKALQDHRRRNPKAEFIFAGNTGKPLVLANLARRTIIPALVKAKLPWRGWHAYRRGLATNLYGLGASDKIVQAIMRHANVSTTMAFYVKPVAGDSHREMAKLEKAFKRSK